MKRRMTTKAGMGVVLCAGIVIGGISMHFILAMAGSLDPPAPPGPTMKTLDEVEPRIPIPGSPTPAPIFVIDQPGSYYLEGDRNCSGLGIHVTAGDVTIDLMGYALIGTDLGSDVGIGITSGTNIEIRNGTVRDFGGVGIFANSTAVKNVRIIGLRVVSNGTNGISVSGVGGLIKDCTASENGNYGIDTARSYTVSGCIVRQNGNKGIRAGHGNTVIGNTVYFNGDDGIYTGNACVISHNTVLDNSGNYGINAGTACTVTHNNQHNSQSGYQIDSGSTCIGNVANANERYGFHITRSLVDQNAAYDNNQVGGYVNMYTSSCTLGTNHAP